jgi:hypothetical protein
VDVSVIIVNYNTKELTQSCIDSVFEKTEGIDYEVILVDNGSTDGSKEHFEKDTRIQYIYSEVNQGFGKANNIGYEHSNGKYLFLLNSDTLLLNNAIKEFYDGMESRTNEIACMGCIMKGKDGQRTHSYGNFPTLGNEIMRRVPLLRRYKKGMFGFDTRPISYIDQHCFEVEYVTGADLFMRKEVADKYGLFDPDFFLYYEETEMQYRYRKQYFISCIIDTPSIIHFEGASSKSGINRWSWNAIPGLMTCYRKMYGTAQLRLFKIILLLLVVPFAIIDWHYPIRGRLEYIAKIIES